MVQRRDVVVAGHLGWSLSRALMIAAAMFYAEHQNHSSKEHPIIPIPPALTIFQALWHLKIIHALCV